MVRQDSICPLDMALSIFEDNLIEIREAIAENILSDLTELKPIVPTEDEELMWVREEVYKLKIEKITQYRLKVIKRIDAYLEHKKNPEKARGKITEMDIERAKEIPIEELFDGKLFKGGSGRMVGRCPFHSGGAEKTPSFYIMADNKAHCFGCSWHGDSIAFYMAKHNMTNKQFPLAVKKMLKH